MTFNNTQTQIARAVFIIYEVLFILNLAFIMHNVYKFVIGLQMKRPLIITFYILIFLGTVFRIVEYGFRIYQADQFETLVIDYANTFALYVSICVELTLLLTM